jgi:hypothetical protein
MISSLLVGLFIIGVAIFISYLIAALVELSFSEAWRIVKNAWLPTVIIWLVGGISLGTVFICNSKKEDCNVTWEMTADNIVEIKVSGKKVEQVILIHESDK